MLELADRSLRALLRTGLGALREPEPGQLASIQALLQLEQVAQKLGAGLGVPMGDPLGPSGRSDVPGFLARITSDRRAMVLGVLAFCLPVMVLGLLLVALTFSG